jgi:hypothetical protein
MTSEALIRNATADTTGDALLFLLTITHGDLPGPLRFVRNHVDIVSRSNTYTAFPFDVTPPGSGEGGTRPARISIDAIDRTIAATIRSLATPPSLLVEVVLASSPDVVRESLPVFELRSAGGDLFTIEMEINDSAEDETEAAVQWTFTPSTAPALF